MIDDNTKRSIFPPESTRPTARPEKRAGWANTAASAAAPAPSARRSSRPRAATSTERSSSASPTSRISFDVFANDLPSDAGRAPSLRCPRRSCPSHTRSDGRPGIAASTGSARSRHRSPRTSGRSSRAARAIPEIRPPPPIGATSSSISGCCSSISRARRVPCPAITCLVVVWVDQHQVPLRRQLARLHGGLRLRSSPCRTTSAPKARVCSTFTVGVKRGITIVAGIDMRSAWYATACA